MYKRVLLKLSGEQLAGKLEGGIDPETCKWIAGEVKRVVDAGVQVAVMVGGGNFARGRQLAVGDISRTTAHKVGMLGMLMNMMALRDIFEASGIKTNAMSSILAEPFVESFNHSRANEYLNQDHVVMAVGAGRPFLTSDTSAVLLALELDCDVVLKATKVDGVYTSDPEKNPTAKKIDKLSYVEALQNEAIKIMDKSALGAAMEHHMPIVIFNAMEPEHIVRAATGEPLGTKIG